MIRKHFLITEAENEFIKKMSEEKGLSFSDLLRRILDEYIEKYDIDSYKKMTNFVIKEDNSTVIYEVVKRVE